MPYTTSYALNNPLISDEYSVFHPAKATDFGVLAPGANSTTIDGGFGNGNLAYNAGAGSLAMSTAHCKITYITAQGESAASADATVSIAAGTGAFTVTLPTLPSATAGSPEVNAAPIIGWRVYSASSTSTLLNAAANSTTQVQQNFTTTAGVLAGFPVATTAVQVLIYGAGAASPTINQSGIQQPLPLITANTSVDYFLLVRKDFRVQKLVEFSRPNASSDPAALIVSQADCIGPVWPQSTAVPHYQGGSVSNLSFIMLNNQLFACTTAGTTGSTVPAFNFTQGQTTTDNTAVWTCLGYRGLIRIRFSNTSATTGSPVAQDYWFAQL
jgi:hypothetical protein